MPLPRTLVYNDLSGDEVKHILMERFGALLNDVPYLQKHITLPRVRMTLTVTLQCWADQSNPDLHAIDDFVEIRAETSVDASAKGDPPDKVREDHGITPPSPTRGPIAIEDNVIPDGRRMLMPNGVVVDRTGKHNNARADSTVIEQDFGPARTRDQQATEFFRNQQRSGAVASPKWNNKDTE